MKRSLLSFILVFALILSMSSAAYAASAYNFDFVNVETDYELTDVSLVHVDHYYGIATPVRYEHGSKSYYFDFTQFPYDFRNEFTNLYQANGWRSSMTVPADSGAVTVEATVTSGKFMAVLFCKFREGTWRVKIGDTPTYTGLFNSSPITYYVDYVRLSQ